MSEQLHLAFPRHFQPARDAMLQRGPLGLGDLGRQCAPERRLLEAESVVATHQPPACLDVAELRLDLSRRRRRHQPHPRWKRLREEPEDAERLPQRLVVREIELRPLLRIDAERIERRDPALPRRSSAPWWRSWCTMRSSRAGLPCAASRRRVARARAGGSIPMRARAPPSHGRETSQHEPVTSQFGQEAALGALGGGARGRAAQP